MEEALDELIPTRATLLVRLKDWQDQASWKDFFDTYRTLILGVALKAGLTRSEADEVVQETMIAVARYIPDFHYNQATGSFKSWLLNMTRWRILDQLRKRPPVATPLPAHDAEAETVITLAASALCGDLTSPVLASVWDEEWEDKLLAAATQKVKRQLDPKKFQIYDFYVNKGWPPEKVAATFGISINQVYLAKHRVTEMLVAEIKKLELNAE
jgi:RNA polymerase sigma-70 factor (ECF subfamily)